MSQELTKVGEFPGPLALSLSEQEVKEFQEAWNANIGSGGISVTDLQRIKIVNGPTPLLMAPVLGGEQPVPKVEGVVVLSKMRRAYWKSKDASNVPPDCSSNDSKKGSGTPGGNCEDCPLAVFGSDGAGQACKQIRDLFIIRGDDMLPEILSLPPTSLDAARKFFVTLQGRRIPYYGAIIAIEVQKAQNPQGKPYGKATFTHVRTLNPAEKQRAMEFGAMCEQFAERIPVRRQDSE